MYLRIVMICFNIENRGTYQRAFRLAKSLSCLGHELTVLASDSSSKKITEKSMDNVSVVTFPSILHGSLQSGWDIYETMKRIQWLKNYSFDIVHAFESRPNVIYPALFAKEKGATLFTDWADWFGKGGSVEERPNRIFKTILRPIETYFEEHFRTLAKGTTVICSTLFDKAMALGIDERDILLVRNGLDNEFLKPVDLKLARSYVNLPKDDFIIGYVGASFPKDVILMRASFELVKEKISKVKLLHIGRSNYAIEPDENIIHTGNIDNQSLNYFLNACDIFWLPLSDTNANRGRFPIKLSDYLSVGRPVIATAVGDLKDFFNKNHVGLLATDNPESIAKNVINLYNDQTKTKILSRNALLTAQSYENSWEKYAKDLEAFYLSKLTDF